MDPIGDKTFVLGIGAQKAGTSWLFRYLGNRPDFYMSPIKELHWFDAKHRPELTDHFNNRFIRRTVDWVREGDSTKKGPIMGAALLDRVSMISGGLEYHQFFETRVPAESRFFGEVTPSYALLPERGFREIRKSFPKVKLIFLLRDPVDRLHSQLRMAQRKDFFDDASEMFLKTLDMPRIIERSLYHETIGRLDRVFEEGEVFVGFYESLFSDEGISEICRFLDCEFLPGDYQRKINADGGESAAALPPAAVEAGIEKFAEVYAFCRERYGDRVPKNWKA